MYKTPDYPVSDHASASNFSVRGKSRKYAPRAAPLRRHPLPHKAAIAVEGSPDFLFFQEGERCLGGDRHYAWRSFFFRVASWSGEPAACGEILAMAWMARDELARELQAPYHDSFLAWLDHGGTSFRSRWCD